MPTLHRLSRLPRPFRLILACALAGLGFGCALAPSWHWEKAGATPENYQTELNQCKTRVYSGTDGIVTNASVRRMQACMESKGWSKVDN